MTRRIPAVLALVILVAALTFPVGAGGSDALVEVGSLDSSIVIDIPYATTKNFTKKKLYPANRALLRKPVAEALVRVQKALRGRGEGLKIWDAYRPLSVQKYMWSLVPDPRYVADPRTGSKHNRGAAVDVTLVDRAGRELEMPTKFDDFSSRASRSWQGATAEALKNRHILEDAMKAEGFIPLPTEWWHFDYRNWKEYGVLDLSLESAVKKSPAPRNASPKTPRDGFILHKGAQLGKGTLAGATLAGGAVKAMNGASPASCTSPWLRVPGGVVRLVPSWNIRCPRGAGWAVHLQLQDTGATASEWLYLGQGGKSGLSGEKAISCALGSVDIDNIKFTRAPSKVRYRVTLFGEGAALESFCLAWRNAVPYDAETLARGMKGSVRRLEVPWRSQYAEEKSLASRICCPTSTTMVMEHLGVKRPTAEVAAMMYCREHDLYGVWWGPPQAACQLGLSGYVRFFSSWPDVQREIAAGRPVIASISFGKGELKGAPRPSSLGHLIVVTGFDSSGRVLVNDPAGTSKETGVIALDRRELGRAWFGHAGVGIILRR